MSIIERQSELGKSIFEINTNTLKELATLQRENFEKYFSTNRSYGEKLPEIKDVSSFVSLQREYGETLWGNVREAVETQNGILRGAFEETRVALEKAFKTEAADDEADEKPAKAKAKTKAKSEAA
jgi:Phasin protein